jgi:hypothetical protein
VTAVDGPGGDGVVDRLRADDRRDHRQLVGVVVLGDADGRSRLFELACADLLARLCGIGIALVVWFVGPQATDRRVDRRGVRIAVAPGLVGRVIAVDVRRHADQVLTIHPWCVIGWACPTAVGKNRRP